MEDNFFTWFFLLAIPLFALGMILVKKPIHAALCFLGTLLFQGALFLELLAEFIGVMQVLVYAGAILVIFVFVIVLFQDAHEKLHYTIGKSSPILLAVAAISFLLLLGQMLFLLTPIEKLPLPKPGYGTVEAIGERLYIDFFFPFEAMTLLFLLAAVGAQLIGKKEKE